MMDRIGNIIAANDQELRELLDNMTTQQLHDVAEEWNWDDEISTLSAILDCSHCSLATALLLYWRGTPQYFCQYLHRDEVDNTELKLYDFLAKIERDIASDTFIIDAVSFDPRNSRGMNWTLDNYSEVPYVRPIPDYMCLFIANGVIGHFKVPIIIGRTPAREKKFDFSKGLEDLFNS